MATADNAQEWQILETIYKTDVDGMFRTLQNCLIFRGWAITIFAGMLTASIISELPLISFMGIFPLVVFFYSEVRYDARRIIYQKRISDIEEHFMSSRINDLKTRLNINRNVLSQSFPLFADAKLTYNYGKAQNLATKRPVRLLTYIFLCLVLGVFGIYKTLSFA